MRVTSPAFALLGFCACLSPERLLFPHPPVGAQVMVWMTDPARPGPVMATAGSVGDVAPIALTTETESPKRVFVLFYDNNLNDLGLSAGALLPAASELCRSCALLTPSARFRRDFPVDEEWEEIPAVGQEVLDFLVSDSYPRCTSCLELEAIRVGEPELGCPSAVMFPRSRPDAIFVQLAVNGARAGEPGRKLGFVTRSEFEEICRTDVVVTAAAELPGNQVFLVAGSDVMVLDVTTQRPSSRCQFLFGSTVRLPQNGKKAAFQVVLSDPGEPFEVVTLSTPPSLPDPPTSTAAPDLEALVHRATEIGAGFEVLGGFQITLGRAGDNWLRRIGPGQIEVIQFEGFARSWDGSSESKLTPIAVQGASIDRIFEFIPADRTSPTGQEEFLLARTGPFDANVFARRTDDPSNEWSRQLHTDVASSIEWAQRLPAGLLVGTANSLSFHPPTGTCKNPVPQLERFSSTPQIFRALPEDEGILYLATPNSDSPCELGLNQIWHFVPRTFCPSSDSR